MDDFLLQVKRPGQYIGEEWNICHKDSNQADIKFALCFPDLYEIGMSNLGVRIIYDLLNKKSGVACERFFHPDKDLENILRTQGLGISSLESGKKICEFDIVGFSLGFELCYTNVLNMLNLGALPLEASSRGNDVPLIIGGGPCVANPEPIHAFFDLFLIGEAEEALPELINLYAVFKQRYKQNKISKLELLVELSKIEGIYAPNLYNVTHNKDGHILEFRPRMEGVRPTIKKRFVARLDPGDFPVKWLVPYIPIIHDRITLEIARGCPNNCRFCQSRNFYFPYRERKAEEVINLAESSYKNTGYEELSLVGLSTSDHRNMEVILRDVVGRFKDRGVSVSLPSIKPNQAVGEFSQLLASIKKTGLTFAPEAATVDLRKILNKNFDETAFFDSLLEAFGNGYRHVKLYFMIGLPLEEMADVDKIVEFCDHVSCLRKKISKGKAFVNVSVNNMIPKPHTPFQWFAMQDALTLGEKQLRIKKGNYNPNLKFSFHNLQMSFLEAILSRGDRRLSKVILQAYNTGARFDAWNESFNFEKWLSAFNACGIKPEFYIREIGRQELLPWDFIDIGVDKKLLLKEFEDIRGLRN
ncbi:MAG: TIGR03960 family B12-binding radical SAM protein [Candidatus Omnitrophota bacterium]